MSEKQIFMVIISFFCTVLLLLSRGATPKSAADTGQINATPQQETLHPSREFALQGARAQAMASYFVHARILSIKYYNGGQERKFSPVDFALGWGPMSNRDVLKNFTISQGDRWYYWESHNMPITANDVIANSVNTHIIPANNDVFRVVQQKEVGDEVKLTGYLVNIYDNGWEWHTSMSRTDTGAGSCEIMYVTNIE